MNTQLPARLRTIRLLTTSKRTLTATRTLTRAHPIYIHTTPTPRSRRPAASPRKPQNPVPHIDTCPAPQCACKPTPDLDIDREGNLRGAFVPYKEQVLVCTGRDDWVSKVEEEEGAAGDVVRGLKGGLGRGGKFCDVSLCL